MQDNRAVGNSRLTHRDVLSVSCKQVPEPDLWHDPNREKGSLLLYQVCGNSLLLTELFQQRDPTGRIDVSATDDGAYLFAVKNFGMIVNGSNHGCRRGLYGHAHLLPE